MSNTIFDLIERNELNTIKKLIENNPNILNETDKNNVTPLLYSRYLNKLDVSKILYSSKHKFSVHESIAMGDLEAVKKIISENNTIVNQYSKDGWTPLHLASFWGYKYIVEFLISSKAEIDLPSKNPTSLGNSALQAAIAMENIEIVEFLIMNGSNVNFIQQPSGYTPLHIAAARNNTTLTNLLLSSGADKGMMSNDGKKPVDIAIERKSDLVIDLLT